MKGNSKTRRLFITITIMAGFASSCSVASLGTDLQIFTIEMLGVPESPQTVTGTEDPKFQNYALEGVNFAAAGEDPPGSTVIYSGEDAKEHKIVNRPQIIFQKDVSDFNGLSYEAVSLRFASLVSGGSKSNSEDVSISLTDPTQTLVKSFTIEEGKGIVLTVKILWKNTVRVNFMEEPEFNLSFGAD